jgi:hypothetical protein
MDVPHSYRTRTAVPVPVHCTVLVQYLVQYLVLPYLLVLATEVGRNLVLLLRLLNATSRPTVMGPVAAGSTAVVPS